MELKKKLAGIVLVLTMLFSYTVYAKSGVQIEQIQAMMPDITVYYRTDDPSAPTAALGSEELKLSGDPVTFEKSDKILHYYVMLDCSGTMKEFFTEVKQELKNLASEVGDRTKLTVYTFGNATELAVTGDETAEEMQKVIEDLNCDQSYTNMFSCIYDVCDEAQDQRRTALVDGQEERAVGILITDGADAEEQAGRTMAEAEEKLSDTGFPVYALGAVIQNEKGVRDSGSAELKNLGQLSKKSGGELYTFGAENADEQNVSDAFKKTKDLLLNETMVAAFQASTNRLPGESKLTMTVGNKTDKALITAAVSVPDEEIPKIIDIRQEGAKIVLTFNKKVEGADQASAYQVTDSDGKSFQVNYPVEYQNDTAVLTFSEPLYDEEYHVHVEGISDVSQEKNPLTADLTIEITGNPAPKEENSIIRFLRTWAWLVIAAIILVLVIAAVVIYRKIKKRKTLIFVDEKPVMTSNVEVHKHVPLQEKNGLPIKFQIVGSDREKVVVEALLKDNLIIGRASTCDVFFDDKKMSRRHFKLELDQDIILIEDLGTTNGTIVNGVRLHGKRKLRRGDRILAGSLEMEIRW